LSERLDAELESIVAARERPLASLSVLAIRDGRVVYHRQFGYRRIDATDPSRNRPADGNTLYRIASISKLVTALGTMKMVEQGRLALDADVGDYLGYPLRNPRFPSTPITLRMLLSHTSSLRDDGGYTWPAGVRMRDVLVPGGKLHGNGAMWSEEAAPGAYFSYCNLNSGVVATIMEKASGERFDRLMRRLVLEPLRMRGGFNPAEFAPERIADIATLYRKADGEEGPWHPAGPWIAQVDDYSREPPAHRSGPDYAIGSNGTLFGPQGNLRASAADLGRVMLMLMNGGAIDGIPLLRRETVEAVLARQWTRQGDNGMGRYGKRPDRFNAWGLGVQHFLDVSGPGSGDRLVEGGGLRAVGHLGDAYGLRATFAFDPARRDGIISLVGGTGFDPETDRGRYSAFSRHEERILTAVHRHALSAGAHLGEHA
jgi:CubicO group peptidase (beta-lactamase class C family)